MNKEILMLIVIGVALLFLVVSIIKKAIKLIVTILVVIIALTFIDIFVYGTNPIDEVKAYKTNIQYGRDIGDLTIKIKDSVANIESDIQNFSKKSNLDRELVKENRKLHQYKKVLATLKHTKRLNGIHNKYSEYLNDIVNISDSTVKISKSTTKGLKIKNEQEKNIKNIMDKLEEISKGKF
ncbi:hypothetical protein [Clostridium oryzae]|uniref:Uncharacterized protein n=1 Tax=Clostridium oryzae TaxID=1450648 RepID=A0A1V4I4X7_9CLOT|nr:hypothetical protein [Clostridium oryzae]OPJ55026.1 hypothetical protein CLORY_44760 [Clostridium oryzae]